MAFNAAELSGDAQHHRLGIDALELDLALAKIGLDAGQAPKEIIIPERAAEFAVADGFQPDLFLVFFGLPLIGLRIEPWSAAWLGLTLCTSAFLAEIWRGGVEALPLGQWDAAASLGLQPIAKLRLVILPQAFAITRISRAMERRSLAPKLA